MTWKEIQPDEVDAGDYIDINGRLTEIDDVFTFKLYYKRDGELGKIGRHIEELGAKYKRKVEEHPHELIPTESGAVIRIGKCVYESYKGGWRQIGVEVFFSHETVQWCADRQGFEVLRPDMEITEEMVERAGRELWKIIFFRHGEDANQEWERDKPSLGAYYKAQARRVIEAALGGERR